MKRWVSLLVLGAGAMYSGAVLADGAALQRKRGSLWREPVSAAAAGAVFAGDGIFDRAAFALALGFS